ncbi:MAG TPA: ATP-binding protein [Daejeonella sp.]|nr:ATP-binding protein [Daejeonella sp.]
MKQPASFFNWSLEKLLSSESDSFNKSKIKILFTVLVFTLLKLAVAISVSWTQQQNFQLLRAAVLLAVYTLLLKLLLANKAYLKVITHLMIVAGLLVIWTNVFFSAKTVNIITLQFIFMLILSSFYLLERRLAIAYALMSILPALWHLDFDDPLFSDILSNNQLASPGFEIVVVLNFATIVVAHYLFQQAFLENAAEKENLNKQLRLAVKEANEAGALKSHFLSTMSHELRTPLNSVIGISELLLNDAHHDEQIENLKILKFSALNLHALINDILDFNKLESDKVDLEAIPVHLYQLMNDISSGLRFQAKEKGLNFVLDIDEAIIGKYVLTDPTRITQIIYNMAGNAIRFTEVGTVSIHLIVLFSDDDHLNIGFSVTDTGIGISADKQEAIFEPFIQASSSTSRNFGGTGLGLAIVKRLLARFDSSIHLESAPGFGSTFGFQIVFKRDAGPKDAVLAEGEGDYDLSGLKILAGEDNQMNRLLLKKVLAKWNNEPVFALNGREVIDEVILHDYDVVLMDLHMPVVDGFEAAKAIRAITDPLKSNIRIIALTAAVSADLYNEIREARIDDYIHKPFKLEELHSKLKDVALKT